jgi:squalene-hopene/tetraprenyl-beta-curcumene cyclase
VAAGSPNLIAEGLEWLAAHQNSDGGWGDTVLSFSNISTSALCWAAFGVVPGADARFRGTVEKAEAYLAAKAGGITPEKLASAIIHRYGKDRTFSVPILTMCAISGRLGQGREAWKHVIPLPFELAALPHKFFALLRMPVVSYALPALIAIGQARHVNAPSRNPAARFLRMAVRQKTLNKLQSIQPASGGFLEATPLTSFVCMSLAVAGQHDSQVARAGRKFLCESVLQDGSWPIDTNLATWVTTLSVQALGAHGLALAPDFQKTRLRQWLLDQQYRTIHPYTQAAPGGWAWTDLSGGVPDADDTSGALLALARLGESSTEVSLAAAGGSQWLLGLQNSDGGVPTFCRGWTHLPFDQSSPDITAHALQAWGTWREKLPENLRRRVAKAEGRARVYLLTSQQPDGSWIPLWFGNQREKAEENRVYGTSKVVGGLLGGNWAEDQRVRKAIERGVEWLISCQAADGAWGGGPAKHPSMEESALSLEALCISWNKGVRQRGLLDAIERGFAWLLEELRSGRWTQPSPIGFYFAKLWYFEKLYPIIFTVAALREGLKVVEESGGDLPCA